MHIQFREQQERIPSRLIGTRLGRIRYGFGFLPLPSNWKLFARSQMNHGLPGGVN